MEEQKRQKNIEQDVSSM